MSSMFGPPAAPLSWVEKFVMLTIFFWLMVFMAVGVYSVADWLCEHILLGWR